jgi:hypothetical protein
MAYYLLLFILLAALVPYIAFYFRSVLVQGLGLRARFIIVASSLYGKTRG